MEYGTPQRSGDPLDADTLKALLALLVDVLGDATARRGKVAKFQQRVRNAPSEGPVSEVLGELAYDLDFYEADPIVRAEDPSYYGDERLEVEIRAAFARLRELGLQV